MQLLNSRHFPAFFGNLQPINDKYNMFSYHQWLKKNPYKLNPATGKRFQFQGPEYERNEETGGSMTLSGLLP